MHDTVPAQALSRPTSLGNVHNPLWRSNRLVEVPAGAPLFMRSGAPQVHDSSLANSIFTLGILQETRRESPGHSSRR
jgi:hypothetical protein